jgi:hypothetical protein
MRLIPGNSELRDAPLPALRRGLLVALPVGAAVLINLQLDSPVAGGLSTGALLAGSLAFDAPTPVHLAALYSAADRRVPEPSTATTV